MDYKAFYSEVVEWIGQSNHHVVKYGIDSQTFWDWVTASAGALCEKYENKSLAIKQMMLLTEWLEDAYLKNKSEKDG